MTTLTQRQADQVRAVVAIGNAICDSVKVAKSEGATGGLLYAACMTTMPLHTFQTVMNLLVEARRLARYGHQYWHPDYAPDYALVKQDA